MLEPVFRRVIPVQERESGTLSDKKKTDLPRVPGLLSRLEAGDCLGAMDFSALNNSSLDGRGRILKLKKRRLKWFGRGSNSMKICWNC